MLGIIMENEANIKLKSFVEDSKGLLARRYDQSTVHRGQLLRYERGGEAFASTLNYALKYGGSNFVVDAVGAALSAIIDLPEAGSISHRMRNFIRRSSDPNEIAEYAKLITRISRKSPGRLRVTDVPELRAPDEMYRLKVLADLD